MNPTLTSPPDSLHGWLDLASKIAVPSGMWIDGQWSEAGTARTTPLVTPRDQSVVAHVPSGDDRDVDRAVRGARSAFEARVWSGLEPRERGSALVRWAELLDLHRDELAVLLALEMGKPVLVARDIEMRTVVNTIRWYGELADKLMDESPRGRPGSLALVSREPVGVVGAITPWNFPMTLAMFKIPAALVTGNSVVVKPATQTPLSLLRAAELACQAGIPPGVLQVITGSGSGVGAPLALHNDVATLTFTGSSAVGKQLLVYAGQSNAKPVWLELGGKSPNIVFPDAEDLDKAARVAAWAISFNSGQMCTAGSRLVVHRDVHDEVVARVIEHLDSHVIGDPLDPATTLGPLAYRQHRDDVLAEVKAGIATEATLRHGTGEERSDGLHVDPVVFTNVDPRSRLAQHEIFGPVLSVMTFEDDAEAIAIANDSDYGLGSALWTSDLRRAHRLSREIHAGMVWVNCYEEGDTSVPFGGQKLSGHGSDRSEHGLDKFTTLKTTWIDLS